jgi:hypothetical protein
MVAGHGCTPWRMSTVDYDGALARLAPLVGDLPILGASPIVAVWDDDLAPAMAAARRAIHEELVLADLLADMSGAEASAEVPTDTTQT